MEEKSKKTKRLYKFSDGTLERLANKTKNNIEKNQAQLAARGINAATITHLQVLINNFKNFSTDIESRSPNIDAVQAKKTTRQTLTGFINTLRSACNNVFGQNSPTYQRFEFDTIARLKENNYLKAAKKVVRLGQQQQTQLASEGINPLFFSQMQQAIVNYKEAISTADTAKEKRYFEAETRIEKGNILYKEIVRLCSIGKEVFAPISKATYNAYNIEMFIGKSGN